jgi:hypothetical protein
MDLNPSPISNPHPTWDFIEGYFHSVIGFILAVSFYLKEVWTIGAVFFLGAELDFMILMTWVRCQWNLTKGTKTFPTANEWIEESLGYHENSKYVLIFSWILSGVRSGWKSRVITVRVVRGYGLILSIRNLEGGSS